MIYLSCDNVDKSERGVVIDQSVFFAWIYQWIEVLRCSKPQTYSKSGSTDYVKKYRPSQWFM
jgi:hypothetical protein